MTELKIKQKQIVGVYFLSLKHFFHLLRWEKANQEQNEEYYLGKMSCFGLASINSYLEKSIKVTSSNKFSFQLFYVSLEISWANFPKSRVFWLINICTLNIGKKETNKKIKIKVTPHKSTLFCFLEIVWANFFKFNFSD